MLRDMLSIEGDKIKLKSEVFQQILALNKFLIYDDPSAFKILELSKYEGDENDLGDFYSGKMILDDLFSTYNYFGSSLLNQWYFNKQKDVQLVSYLKSVQRFCLQSHKVHLFAY